MNDLIKVAKRIQTIDQNNILYKTLNRQEVKDFIIFLNTEKQLLLGLKSNDEIVGLYRSFEYSEFKDSLPGRKAPAGVVDLRLSEDFYRSFLVNVFVNGDFEILANTIKDDKDLAQIYGEEIIGLSAESLNALVEFILPIYINETEKYIFQ